MHFPSDYSEDYYKQLVSEEVTEIINNKGVSSWFISNTKQLRNETLDTYKEALGALYYMYLTYFKLLNLRRKAQKKKEIRPDWNLFWGLYDSGDEEE